MFTSISARARKLHYLLVQFSLPIGIGLSILFFCLSTAFHLVQRAPLAEFFVATVNIVLLSSLSRYTVQNLVIKLQRNDHELIAAVFNGLCRNTAELCFLLTAVARRESVIVQIALIGVLMSGYLMVFGTSLFVGGVQSGRQYCPITISKANAQLLVVSLASICISITFKSWFEDGEYDLLAVFRGSAIVLLLESTSYIWLSYYTHTLLDESHMNPALPALGLFPAHLSTSEGNTNKPLKKLHTATQEAIRENEQMQRYSIYANISILICSTPALVFTSIYLLEAFHAPNEKKELFESFVDSVIKPFILATFDHVATILRSQKEVTARIFKIAFGSSFQVSFFVFSLSIIFGWVLGT